MLNSLFKLLRKSWNMTACWLLHETHVCSLVFYVELACRRKEVPTENVIYPNLTKKSQCCLWENIFQENEKEVSQSHILGWLLAI